MKHIIIIGLSFAVPILVRKFADPFFLYRIGDLFARLINRDTESITIADPILLGQGIMGLVILIILELIARKRE